MDRSWMYGKRDFEYLERLHEFITQAVEHQRQQGDDAQLMCPCSACKNRKKVNSGNEMREHLILKGFNPNYKVWIWHGEKENDIPNCPNAVNVEKQVDNIMVDFEVIGEDCNNNEVNERSDDKECNIEADNVDQMMDDLEKDFVDCPEIFQMLVGDSKKALFPDCSKFTRLSAMLRLYTLKAGNGWSDKSFTALLRLLSDMLPKDYSELDECPRCKKSRYKLKEGRKKGGPAKTLWYLSIIPWFKRLFANPKDAEYMLWHDKGRKKDGKLRHVADAPQWRTIDRDFSEFGSEPRNLRLGL
ncbi:uncharacterized protein LOC141601344 [Silene latifolia]|uniref:uncharacterized protein LOC141601344 n=1 Tax=Silene latifolia TaxID=37657 RepID=UPI003D7886C8